MTTPCQHLEHDLGEPCLRSFRFGTITVEAEDDNINDSRYEALVRELESGTLTIPQAIRRFERWIV
jgi:hypothetical protein